MNVIDAATLREKLAANNDILLLDVREEWEHELFNIGGKQISLNEIIEHIDQIDKEKPIVVYCEKGIRSMIAIQRLAERYGYTNLINLSGGMVAWKQL